jgi:thiosulfate/3-mercaptopyruvate sulfurtransferase
MISLTLIAPERLAARLHEEDVLLLDCRKDLADAGRGPRAFAEAHLPSALRAELDSDLSDLSKRDLGRHPLPDADEFSATLSRWGWHPARAVVAYDDAGGALAAARLWWMLRLVGATNVAVLDGGIQAWHALDLPLGNEVAAPATSSVDVRFDASQMVGYEELASGVAAGALLLVDARAAARYRGEVEPLDRAAGHVPGALNRPYADNLDVHGRFKAPALLRAEFGGLIGDADPRRVVHMCGSGVTACHNLLAMEHAGLAGSRVFAPSWSGWSSDPSRPIAIG